MCIFINNETSTASSAVVPNRSDVEYYRLKKGRTYNKFDLFWRQMITTLQSPSLAEVRHTAHTTGLMIWEPKIMQVDPL